MPQIDRAVFNQGAQELVIADNTGMRWSFKALNNPRAFRKGRGYLQEVRGNFDDNGNVNVLDRHDDEASDFYVMCGPRQELLVSKGNNVKDIEVWDQKWGKDSSFDDPIADGVTIRIFAGAPPNTESMAFHRDGTIWISDSANVIRAKLWAQVSKNQTLVEQSGEPEAYDRIEDVNAEFWQAWNWKNGGGGNPLRTIYVNGKHHPSTLVYSVRKVLTDVIFTII